jgi:uncharacterized repeat protein (TIGR02543 family)
MVSPFPLLRAFKIQLLALCLGIAGGIGGTALPAQAQSRILFVGNSFTHGYEPPVLNYNAGAIVDENFGLPNNHPRHESDDSGPWGGVPGIFKKFTDQAGLSYEVHIEAINGQGLEYHYDNALSVIGQAQWNQVVLQELSTGPLPGNRGGNQASFFDYSTRLEQAIHSANPAAKVYLYETWSRADLTYVAGQPYSGLPIEAMGADLHDGYTQAFNQNGHFEAVAPVGDAWLRAIQAGIAMRNPYSPTAGQLDLWTGYFHASKYGSYLNACVLFYQITGVDPRSLGGSEQAAASLGISATAASNLQLIAYEEVSGNPAPVQHTLTVNITGSGTVSKNPNQASYTSGSTVVLTATPAAGQQFSGWSGAATGTANPLNVSMTSDKTITATFTPVAAQYSPSFTLVNADNEQDIQALSTGASLNLATLPTRNLNIRANTSPATVGSVVFALSGAQVQDVTESVAPYALFPDNAGNYPPWVPAVGSYTLQATPYSSTGGGLTFYRGLNVGGTALTIDGQSWEAGTAPNFNVSGPAFANQAVTLNPATDANRATMIRSSVYGTNLDASLGNVPAGTYQVYLYFWEDNSAETFNILVEGQVVDNNYNSGAAGHWDRLGPFAVNINDGMLNISTAGGYANLSGIEVWRQTSSGTAGTPLAINFSVVDQSPGPYTLAVNTTGSGTVSKSPDQLSYASGTTVSLTATPGAGQQFSGWSGDASGNVNPLSVSMSSNKSITATFTAVAAQYSLTVNTTGSGTVSKTPNQATYASGSTVSLSATAAAGFQFTGWSGDASGSTNPLSVIMTANKTITATFTAVVGTQVTSFTLVNADNEQDIQPLSNGASLNLAALPTRNLNVRATTSPATVGSVVWALRGGQVVDQTDAAAPYALFLDNAGNYPPWTPAVGSYTLQATPYASGGGSGLTFYRALNINGGAVSLDGQSWEASTGAVNFTVSGTAFANQAITLNPATDATRASMIRSCRFGTTINAALSSVPAGTYSVYLYVWEDNSAETYTIRLENQVALANYNSGPGGHWDRLGPYSVNVSDGTLDINLSGGYANLSGIEVWRQTAGSTPGTALSISFSVVDQYTLTVNTTGSGTVSKNPNQATYASGSTVSLTASPAAGFQFTGWSGAATGTANPLSVSMTSNKTITATFTATGGGGLTFYRALNINGGAVSLDGQSWEASAGAANFTVSGTAFANQAVTLNPATDATRASLIRSSVYGTNIDAQLRTVPTGTYSVYLYVWEDNSAETYTIRLENQVALANYNSGPGGHWDRLGPYPVTVSDGTLDINLSGGYANLSGIEVWRQNAARATLTTSALVGSALPANEYSGRQAAALPAQVFPNPSGTGRYQLLLPAGFQGAVSYTLVSALGTRLAGGQLAPALGAAPLELDFSRQMTTAGQYYLLLKTPRQSTRLQLIRQ